MSTPSFASSLWFKISLILGLLAAAVGSVILLLSVIYNLTGYIADYNLTFLLFEDRFGSMTYVAQPAWSLFGLALSLMVAAVGILTVSRTSEIAGVGIQRNCLLALFACLPILAFELVFQAYGVLYLPGMSNFLTPDAWFPYVLSIITGTVVAGAIALLGWVIGAVKDGVLRRGDAGMLLIGYVFIGGCLYASLLYDAMTYIGVLTMGTLLFVVGWWRLTNYQAKSPMLTQSGFDRGLVVAGKVAGWLVVIGIIFGAGYVTGGYKVFEPTNSDLNNLYTQYQKLQKSIEQQATPSVTSVQ